MGLSGSSSLITNFMNNTSLFELAGGNYPKPKPFEWLINLAKFIILVALAFQIGHFFLGYAGASLAVIATAKAVLR